MSEEMNELWLAMKSTKYNNTFNEIKNSFYQFDDLADSLKKGLNIIINAMHAEAATFWFYDFFETERIFPKASSGDMDLSSISLGIGEGIAGSVVENNKALMISDCQNDKRWARRVDEKTSFVTKSIICTPLFAPNSKVAFGCIQILNKNDGSLFDDADLEFAGSLTNEFADAFIKKYDGRIIGVNKIQSEFIPDFDEALSKSNVESMLYAAEKSILECGYTLSEAKKILPHLVKIHRILYSKKK